MANRFWVGGTATWDATAGSKWSTTSGGAGGSAVPTAADDVFFDAASGAVTITTSGTTTDVCRSLDCTGFTGTLSHAAATTITIGDATAGASNIALKLVAGMTYTLGNANTSAITFASTSATVQTIDYGGKTTGSVEFNGNGGSWQYISSHTIGATGILTLTRGTLDTNGQTCSWGRFDGSTTNVRALTLGASQITLTGGNVSHWNMNVTTNLTFNSGTSLITVNSTSNTTFTGGGLTYYDVVINSPGGNNMTFSGANSFRNFTYNGTVGDFNPLPLPVGVTQTCSGTFTATGGSNIRRVRIFTVTPGSTATISAASVSLTNVDFMDITGAGAASWTGTSLGDMLGNSGITFTTPRTLYRVGAGGNWTSTAWSLSSGGATGQAAPLAQDDVFVDANASGTINYGGGISTESNIGKNIDFTGFAGTWSGGTTNISLFGSLTVSSGLTMGSNQSLHFKGRSSHTITTNGKTLSGSTTITAPTGTYTLQDNLTISSTLTLVAGTFTANNFNVSCTIFTTSTTTTRVLNMGSGTWSVTGTGTVWNAGNATGSTINADTSTIAITDTSASNKTFSSTTGVSTYNNISITVGGAGLVIFSSTTKQFKDFTVTGGAKSIQLQGNLNITGNFNVLGTAGNLVSITSNSAGSARNLSKSSGTVSADYLSLQDSNATGGAAWYAGANSTNVSGNTGWIFTAPPGGANSNMFLVF